MAPQCDLTTQGAHLSLDCLIEHNTVSDFLLGIHSVGMLSSPILCKRDREGQRVGSSDQAIRKAASCFFIRVR